MRRRGNKVAKKRKIGRPPLPKGSARVARLYCRVLQSEVAEIESAVKTAKMQVSVWIREMLLLAARGRGNKPGG